MAYAGSDALFQGPLERLDDPMVVFVWTEDPVLERDPAALHRLGGRVYGAAHADEVPDDWADVRRHIRRLYLMDTSYEVDHARAVPLPRSATVSPSTSRAFTISARSNQ